MLRKTRLLPVITWCTKVTIVRRLQLLVFGAALIHLVVERAAFDVFYNVLLTGKFVAGFTLLTIMRILYVW